MDDFDDDWKTLMPDSGDYKMSIREALASVGDFLLHVLLVAIPVIAIVALFVYVFVREYLILSFLVGN